MRVCVFVCFFIANVAATVAYCCCWVAIAIAAAQCSIHFFPSLDLVCWSTHTHYVQRAMKWAIQDNNKNEAKWTNDDDYNILFNFILNRAIEANWKENAFLHNCVLHLQALCSIIYDAHSTHTEHFIWNISVDVKVQSANISKLVNCIVCTLCRE